MDWASRLLDIVKLPTKAWVVIAAVTGACLFLPSSFRARLHIDVIPRPYDAIIGFVFVIASVFVLINLIASCAKWMRRNIHSNRRFEHVLQKLDRLDPAECSILREFIIQRQMAIRLPVDNPTVSALVANGVLSRVGRFGRHSHHGILLSYRLSDEAASILAPAMLEIPNEYLLTSDEGHSQLSDTAGQWLMANRPPFASDIARFDRSLSDRW